MTNEQAFAKARALTAGNHHQEAVLLIARHFKCSGIAKAVEGVIMIHEARGHMDRPMIEMMQVLRSDLYTAVEAAHGAETRKAVYDCF
jgi:hypothetical protein